jgi:hypothetical protein
LGGKILKILSYFQDYKNCKTVRNTDNNRGRLLGSNGQSQFLEIALVLVPLNHFTSGIVNANHSIIVNGCRISHSQRHYWQHSARHTHNPPNGSASLIRSTPRFDATDCICVFGGSNHLQSADAINRSL